MNPNLKNFIYSFTLTSSNLVFSFITYPYVSRVLGVSNIGTCDYVDSIINYFVLLSTLGLDSYGIRAIAKCKENKDECNKIFSSLFSINIILCIIAVLILISSTLLFDTLRPYRHFLYIGILKIVFNAFLVDWFYEGISNFRYITLRSLLVKVIYAICVFFLIKTEEDVVLYYLLTTGTIIINALFNFIYAQKFVHLTFWGLRLRHLVIPILSFGFYRILSSLYNTFSIFFLGTTTNSIQVGFFSTATKLYGILIMAFTALTTVLVPKISELVGKRQQVALQEIANKTFDIVFIITIPVIIFCLFYAPHIIFIIAGKGYEGAILPFKIVIFLFFLSAMQQIVIQQFLLAAQSSRGVLALSFIGAISAVLLNIILVREYKSIGASISLVLSQFIVLLCGLYYFKQLMKLTFPFIRMLKYIMASVPYILIGVCFQKAILSWYIVIPLCLYLVWFLIMNLFIIKSSIIDNLFNQNRS